VLLYYGSQEERRGIRNDLLDGNMDHFHILLTTSVKCCLLYSLCTRDSQFALLCMFSLIVAGYRSDVTVSVFCIFQQNIKLSMVLSDYYYYYYYLFLFAKVQTLDSNKHNIRNYKMCKNQAKQLQ